MVYTFRQSSLSNFKHLAFISELKQFEWISLIGLCICIGGEILRKLAMITAESNFHHVVSNFLLLK